MNDSDQTPSVPVTETAQNKEQADNQVAAYSSREGKRAFIQLILIVLAGLVASFAAGVTKTVFVVLAVIIMIVVHEFGHYITAKWSGMKVTEFFVGFGPRVWSFRKGETEYGIRAIPAGGFVKVIGMNNLEEVDPAEEHRAFRSSPAWRRVVMASAGSFMHFVMAFLLAFSLLAFVGKPSQTTGVGSILSLQGQSPAKDAGLQIGDNIRSINGAPVSSWLDITERLSKAEIGVPMTVSVTRDGNPMDFSITPVDRRKVIQEDGRTVLGTDPNVASGFIGISSEKKYHTVGFGEAFTSSVSALGNGTVAVFKAFGKIFSPTGMKTYFDNVMGNVPVEKQNEADQVRFVSPVGLVDVADEAANAGWFAVLSLLFSINLFIGIFNMVPLLPFDGGHVAVAIYERIRSIRRPSAYHVDYAKLLPVSYAVLLVMVLIAGSSLYLDVTNPLPNQFR